MNAVPRVRATLKGFFVCDRCRRDCSDGEDAGGPYGPNRCPEAYRPRKQRVGCLGPLCDEPCDLRRDEGDVEPEALARLAVWLADELNCRLTGLEGDNPV